MQNLIISVLMTLSPSQAIETTAEAQINEKAPSILMVDGGRKQVRIDGGRKQVRIYGGRKQVRI